MVKLLIIADDFTGALDTGVQFSAHGAVTSVITDPAFDFTKVDSSIQVLVMDAETRHLEPEQAYSVVRKAVEHALAAGVCCIYKKTDSALRGNIGAELTAVLDAAGTDRLPFIPAFPKMNRITQNGVHLIDGVPVAESVFGRDPFEPVRHSYLPQIIREQSDVPVCLRIPCEEWKGIVIHDGESQEELRRSALELGRKGELGLMAGCAGFAAELAPVLGLKGKSGRKNLPEGPLLVVCGSVNPVTLRQLDRAEQAGAARFQLSTEQLADPGWMDTEPGKELLEEWEKKIRMAGCTILESQGKRGGHNDTAESLLREQVSRGLAAVLKRLLEMGIQARLMITGGDTLLACTRMLGVRELFLEGELFPGVVLSRMGFGGRDYDLISKSGGLGEEDLLVRMKKQTEWKDCREEAECRMGTA